MKTLRLIVAILASTLSLPVLATDREFADIYTDCGLGALIAPRNDAVAAVTNVTWDSGTTAITSDASSPDSCKGGKQAAAAFILETYPAIEQDLARGEGDHLTALLQIAGCDVAAQAEVASALRSEFSGIASEAGYSERTQYQNAERLFNTLNATIQRSHAASCAIS